MGLLLSALLGAAFFGLRYYELSILPFRWDSHAYGSLFFTVSGMHLAHTLFGCGENAVQLCSLLRGPVERKILVDIDTNCFYWNFVVVSGALVYALLYLDPLVFPF